ncbi:ubiquitin-conjugating enzyme/RWD-like protein [Mycena rosella]|uniref:Ubiquitin-conjugating enzyme/RWD-like protein n=1 Tax=Mycena rosella TaxID=1033263 RepID=A0AAD7D389_MYCRO|nr:ubiquitin-conjugating enzyme/RWD-like protein [Mycena rosella]
MLRGESLPYKLLMPQDSSVLALLSYVDYDDEDESLGLSDFMLWYGLGKSGDGMRRGELTGINTLLSHYSASSLIPHAISFECERWRWFPTKAQETRRESKHLSRLDLLNALFDVFLNRAGSFDTTVSLVLGLVTFSDDASVELELTPVFEEFREQLEEVHAAGDTALYDALDSARQVLTNFRPDLPNLRRRIIIVSDGEDTSSEISPHEVCRSLQKGRIIVDSVQVGPKSDRVLHAISVATGGYRFSPRTSLADALSIFDLETMLYSGDRPYRSAKPLVNTERQFQAYQNFSGSNAIDIVTVDMFPPRAEHKKLKQRVKSAAISVVRPGVGDERMKRIMREIKTVVADPHPNVDVYVNDRDMSFLKIILEAPKDVENCPYKSGTFLLTCDLPAGYPRDPPEIRFVTFILHPNVSKQGKVCIAELGRLWSSDITLKEIFSMIYGILLTPDLENPLEIQASLKYYDDDGTYALAVADAVAKHASKTRAQWQEELED